MSENRPATIDQQKREFMEELDRLLPDVSDDYDDPELEQKYQDLFRPNQVQTGMLAAIPRKCNGDCMYGNACPRQASGDWHRHDEACPVESAVVHQLFQGYVEDLEVDVTKMVEVAMVRDLVNQEVQHLRATASLSNEEFIQQYVAGVDSEGNVITQPDLHKAIDYEDRILKRKEKLRNALLATRESRAKAGQSRMDDATSVADALLQLRRAERAKNNSHQDEFHDEYIDAEVVDSEDDDSER